MTTTTIPTMTTNKTWLITTMMTTKSPAPTPNYKSKTPLSPSRKAITPMTSLKKMMTPWPNTINTKTLFLNGSPTILAKNGPILNFPAPTDSSTKIKPSPHSGLLNSKILSGKGQKKSSKTPSLWSSKKIKMVRPSTSTSSMAFLPKVGSLELCPLLHQDCNTSKSLLSKNNILREVLCHFSFSRTENGSKWLLTLCYLTKSSKTTETAFTVLATTHKSSGFLWLKKRTSSCTGITKTHQKQTSWNLWLIWQAV